MLPLDAFSSDAHHAASLHAVTCIVFLNSVLPCPVCTGDAYVQLLATVAAMYSW